MFLFAPEGNHFRIKLKTLVEGNYIENLNDPEDSSKTFYDETSGVELEKGVTNSNTYKIISVTLMGSKRDIITADIKTLNRKDVINRGK